MRWSQVVRFNIAHDNRKTDVSDLYGVGDLTDFLGGAGIDLALAFANGLISQESDTSIALPEGSSGRRVDLVNKQISEAVNNYTNGNYFLKTEPINLLAVRQGVQNNNAEINLESYTGSKIKLKAGSAAEARTDARIQLSYKETDENEKIIDNHNTELNYQNLIFDNSNEDASGSGASFTLYHTIGADGFTITSTTNQNTSSQIQNTLTI